MRVMLDIDGVIYPWADMANKVCMEEFGILDPGPHVHWYHLKDHLTSEQWKWVWSDQGMRKIFGQRECYPYSYRFARLLDDPTFETHFVTHRKPSVLGTITADYLEWMFPGATWEGLHVCGSTPKTELMEFDAVVDDKPETILDFLTMGVKVFVPRRPWNEVVGKTWGEDSNLVYYDNPEEVALQLT